MAAMVITQANKTISKKSIFICVQQLERFFSLIILCMEIGGFCLTASLGSFSRGNRSRTNLKLALYPAAQPNDKTTRPGHDQAQQNCVLHRFRPIFGTNELASLFHLLCRIKSRIPKIAI
jgi:hypothetical protein